MTAVPTAPRQNPAAVPATSTWEWVTPKQAAEYLLGNTHNRNIQALRVARYSRDMAAGHWVPTHQGVAFTSEGVLIDGQHRLQSQIEAGVGLWTLVTRDLPLDAQRFVDQGRARGAGDFFEGKYANHRAAAIRHLIAIRNAEGDLYAHTMARQVQDVTIGDIHAYVEAEPGICGDLETLAPLAPPASKHSPVGPASLLSAAVTYPGVADEVLNGLTTGVGLDQGSPVLAMRNSGLNFTRNQGHALIAALKVFSMATKGQELRVLRVSPTERLRVDVR